MSDTKQRQIYAIVLLTLPLKLSVLLTMYYSISVYRALHPLCKQYHMLILFFLYDFRGTLQADKQRLCGRQITHSAACGWLVSVPAVLTNPCQLNVNQGRIKHATHTAGKVPVLRPVRKLSSVRTDNENKNRPVS